MQLGLRTQLVVLLTALMVATVLLTSLAVLGLTRRTMEQQAQETATRVARVAATTISSAVPPDEPLQTPRNIANIERLCELFSRQFEATRMAVVGFGDDGSLDVLASYPPDSVDAVADVEFLVARAVRDPLSHISDTPDGVRQVDVFAPVRVGGRSAAVLRLEFPLGEVQRLGTTSQQLLLLYLVLDALLIGLIAYLAMTRLIVRPILAISAATDRVADGDFQSTVHVRSRNEIGTLARNFDRMVERLRDGRAALERRLEELGRSKEALERTRDELVLSEKMATVGGLAAGIAHEIGNPLAAVTGLLELLRDREGFDDDEIDDLVARADREISRIGTIIAELLDYARVEEALPEAIDIRVPIEAAAALVTHHPRGRTLRMVVPDGLPSVPVWASETPLVQVFLNLLLNAADATGEGGTVTVGWAVDDGVPAGVSVKVEDDGPGVPADLLPRLFEPFFTTKEAGKGTGLGLAMSQRIVDRFGGRIWVESGDAGATFHIWLPAPPDDQIPSGK